MPKWAISLGAALTLFLVCGAGSCQEPKRTVSSFGDLKESDRVLVPIGPGNAQKIHYKSCVAVWNQLVPAYGCTWSPLSEGMGEGALKETEASCSNLSNVVPSKDLSEALEQYAKKSDRVLSDMDQAVSSLCSNSTAMFCPNDIRIDRALFARWVKEHADELKQIVQTVKREPHCCGVLIKFDYFNLWVVRYDDGLCLIEPAYSGEIYPVIAVKDAYLVDMHEAERGPVGGKNLAFIRSPWDGPSERPAQITVFWRISVSLPSYPGNVVVHNDLNDLKKEPKSWAPVVISEEALR